MYYDLPDDVRNIIDEKKKEMELRDALLNELKAFDKVAWCKERHKRGKFPYWKAFYNTDAIDILECIEDFYDCGEVSSDYIDGVYDESIDNVYDFYNRLTRQVFNNDDNA